MTGRTSASGIKSRKPLMVRVWRKLHIGRANDCWEWQGKRDPDGYGHTKVGDTSLLVHRVMFEYVWGKAQDFVCHTCDNPPCANPLHLFEGDAMTNHWDASAKGRLDWKDDVGRAQRASERMCRFRREGRI